MAATPRTERIVYSDFFTNFDVKPKLRGEIGSTPLLRKTNVDAVKQSIRNILLTDKGERPFQPKFGGNIRAMLFENISPHFFITTEEYIKDVLLAHEPRADIIDVYCAETYNEHEVAITIMFRVVNVQEPITLELILERVR